jgi:hypothetical protein
VHFSAYFWLLAHFDLIIKNIPSICMWWYMPVIPAIGEAEAGGSARAKVGTSCLKNKTK